MTVSSVQKKLTLTLTDPQLGVLVCGADDQLADVFHQLLVSGVTVKHHYQQMSDTLHALLQPLLDGIDHGQYTAHPDTVSEQDVRSADAVVCDPCYPDCAMIVQWCRLARVPIYVPGDTGISTCVIPSLPGALEPLLTLDDGFGDAGQGEVYLVGAGPGDPDLLTFRALKLIRRADVVLYDRLVSADIVAMCRQGVEKVYVGKQRAEHTMRQELINDTLARYAQQGKKVLRLKGGDPFIFGRGGEEIETLSALGIPFQIVPGITAATGCASYAGIPLTHRDHAQSCVFVTGHLKAGALALNWAALAQPSQTIVCYMGLVGLPVFCVSLIEHGLPAETPAALIERGTTSAQGVYVGTLESLPDLIAQHEVSAPTLIMVGTVVTLRDKFAWFDA